jgi:DNA-binding response OmpR family regulator
MYGGGTTTKVGTILLVDDCDDIRRVVRDRLVGNGFEVLEATSAEDGLTLLEEHPVDAVLLDVHLPGIDGFAMLRSIRLFGQLPVILLTAAADETDRVLGLEMGADDYVIKPFSARELVARVRAVLRRAQIGNDKPLITHGNLVIDTSARQASLRGEPLMLSPRAYDLLAFMAARPGRAFSRDELLQEVWRSEPEWQNIATVTEHVHRLRRQIESNPERPAHLITVRGSGYRFDP